MAESSQTEPAPRAPGRSGKSGPKGVLESLLARSQADSWVEVLFVPLVLIVLFVYLAASTGGFLEQQNLTNIILQGSILAIVAFGMTFVILCGELDLSVGSGVALVSVVSALVMRDSGSVVLGLAAGIGVGILLGIVNGMIVTKLKVPSFIATLGMLVIAHGIALALTDGAVIGQLPEGVGAIASDRFLGIRWLIWITIAVFVILLLVNVRTSFGVKVLSVGGNREAARLSGISPDRVTFLCFVIVGVTVGIAGVALTSRVQSGQPNAGSLLALTSIAAVIVGGTSLVGGRGSVGRTLGGVLLLAVLENGLDVKGVSIEIKQAIIGVVFIAAASVEYLRRQVEKRTDRAKIPAKPAVAGAASGSSGGRPARGSPE